MFGKPTWKRLVEAVEDRAGGNNHALAQKIAAEYLGMQPYTELLRAGGSLLPHFVHMCSYPYMRMLARQTVAARP